MPKKWTKEGFIRNACENYPWKIYLSESQKGKYKVNVQLNDIQGILASTPQKACVKTVYSRDAAREYINHIEKKIPDTRHRVSEFLHILLCESTDPEKIQWIQRVYSEWRDVTGRDDPRAFLVDIIRRYNNRRAWKQIFKLIAQLKFQLSQILDYLHSINYPYTELSAPVIVRPKLEPMLPKPVEPETITSVMIRKVIAESKETQELLETALDENEQLKKQLEEYAELKKEVERLEIWRERATILQKELDLAQAEVELRDHVMGEQVQ